MTGSLSITTNFFRWFYVIQVYNFELFNNIISEKDKK